MFAVAVPGRDPRNRKNAADNMQLAATQGVHGAGESRDQRDLVLIGGIATGETYLAMSIAGACIRN